MPTLATTLLGLALPTQGELTGTWGDTVNNSITNLTDSAIAGTTTISADADITLTDTQLAANQARQAVLLWTASGTVTRNITAPARSKPYIVINATGSTQSIVVRGAGPTAGVTIPAGIRALVAWNGSDFVVVAASVAGANTQIQFNNNGIAGGSPNLTWDGANVRIGAQGDLRFADADSSNYVAIHSPAVVAANWTMTLPAADGTANQLVRTDGAGNLSFTNIITAPVVNDGYTEEVYTATTASSSITLDLANGSVQFWTLNQNISLTMTTISAGKSMTLFLKQDGSGSRAVSSWGGTVLWPNNTAPSLTPIPNKVDKFVFTNVGGYIYGSVAGQNYNL
jgi:hypothetical protein